MLFNIIVSRGVNTIEESIDFAQSKTDKQISPLISSSENSSHHQNGDENRLQNDNLLEDFVIDNKHFQNIFSNLLHGGIALSKILYDEKGNPIDFIVLEANQSFEDIFGVKREQILLKQATKFAPKIRKIFVNYLGIFSRVATSGKTEQSEIYFQVQDKWYQVHVYSPKKGYVISAFMDLTERKKAERQHALSEKRYRGLYETTQDGIMARNITGRMIDCNRAYAKMLGYTKKELRKMSVQQLLPEKWHDQREEVVNKVLQTGHSFVFEREYKRKDGSIFPASVRTWRLTDERGKAVGIWSIVRDISDQKVLQKKLEQYAGVLEKLITERTKRLKDSERLAAIGQTAGMVGHDLRNPLQTMLGELYLANFDINSLPENEAKINLQESIHVIEEQAIYMDKIVSDLQAFVQPIKLNKKLTNLKELVGSVLSSATIPINVAIQTYIEDNFPEINTDSLLMKRVLINLVTNAVQAMPDGGKLTLTSKVHPQGQISVTVEDNGVGIPEKIKPQIFTPLFTTKPRGQGFGLAVCKRVIEAHGGAISFESQEGKGAKFTIQFPAI